MPDSPLRKIFSAAGGGLVIIPLIWLIGTAILFWLNLNSTPAFSTLCIIGLIGGSIAAAHYGGYKSVVLLIIATALIFGFEFITIDFSSDGVVYHIPTLEAMLQGWNPFYENYPYTYIDQVAALLQHYARGLEVSGLAPAALLGNYQYGNILNPILAVACILLGIGVLPIINLSQRTVGAFMLALNPLVIAQMPTFYNDSLLWSEILIMVFALILILQNPAKRNPSRRKRSDSPGSFPLLLLISATLFAISSKFTHLFYCAIIWAVILIWMLIRKRNIKLILLTGIITAIFGIAIINYNPYITNAIGWGNPLYPILGCEGFDIMTGNTPPVYHGNSRFYNLLISNFSSADTAWECITAPWHFNILQTGLGVDNRFCYYGLLFPIMLLVSLVCIGMSRRQGLAILIILLLIGASLCFEQGWWTRYAPFLWAIIPMGYIWPLLPDNRGRLQLNRCYSEQSPRMRSRRLWMKTMRFTLILLTLITWSIGIGRIWRQTERFTPETYIDQFDGSLILNH